MCTITYTVHASSIIFSLNYQCVHLLPIIFMYSTLHFHTVETSKQLHIYYYIMHFCATPLDHYFYKTFIKLGIYAGIFHQSRPLYLRVYYYFIHSFAIDHYTVKFQNLIVTFTMDTNCSTFTNYLCYIYVCVSIIQFCIIVCCVIV